MSRFSVFGIEHIPKIFAGDEIGTIIIEALTKQGEQLQLGDIVVITSKIVSKAEGCSVRLEEVEPSAFSTQLAQSIGKNPAEVEVILRQSKSSIKMSESVLIMETLHGFICANAGVDHSNTGKDGSLLFLPTDPDASADKIRKDLQNWYGTEIAVIISDTFGRPWRMGQTNIAIGISGLLPILDYKGGYDWFGQPLSSTEIAIADELAGCAELVMGKAEGIPVAVIRGYDYPKGDGRSTDLIRPKHMDLFR